MFSDNDLERADWFLLQNGAVNLFYKKDVFETAKKELSELGYRLAHVECNTAEEFKRDISDALNWEEQFGYKTWDGNLNALNDGLDSPPMNTKKLLAIACKNFEKLYLSDKDFATGFLDIFEYQSRNRLLFGERLIALVQTNDPNFESGEIGSRKALWNPKEWLDSERGL